MAFTEIIVFMLWLYSKQYMVLLVQNNCTLKIHVLECLFPPFMFIANKLLILFLHIKKIYLYFTFNTLLIIKYNI